MSVRTERRSWQLPPLPDLQIRRRGDEVPAVMRMQRSPMTLDALPSLPVRVRRGAYVSHGTRDASEWPPPDKRASRDDVGSATIDLVLDHVLTPADVLENRRDAELLAAVGVAFVSAARSGALAGGSSANLAVLQPSGETLLVNDVDRHTVASLRDAIARGSIDRSAQMDGVLLRLSHSGHWGVVSSRATLSDGSVMALDLGRATRTIHSDLGADGAEVIHTRTTATLTLVYASRDVGPAAAFALLSQVRRLIHDKAWLRQHLGTEGAAR